MKAQRPSNPPAAARRSSSAKSASRAHAEILRLLQSAGALLGDGPVTDDTAVHEARKQVRHARALLRLLHQSIDTARYRRENTAMRDAARLLSRARDKKVMSDTLRALRRRAGLPHVRLRSGAPGTLSSNERQQALRALRAIEIRVSRWVLPKDRHHDQLRAIRRLYRRTRREHSIAANRPTDRNLHELRKQTKYLWRASQFVAPRRSGELHGLSVKAHRLADVLGEDHDLAVLAARLRRRGVAKLPLVERTLLLRTANARRAVLQFRAIKLGHRLLDNRPSGLRRSSE